MSHPRLILVIEDDLPKKKVEKDSEEKYFLTFGSPRFFGLPIAKDEPGSPAALSATIVIRPRKPRKKDEKKEENPDSIFHLPTNLLSFS